MNDMEKLTNPEDSSFFASYAEVAKIFWIYRMAAMFFSLHRNWNNSAAHTLINLKSYE